MSDITAIGNLEGRLAGHLAAALANHLVCAPARKGDRFNHSFESDFVSAQDALHEIGVYPLEKQDNGSSWYVFSVDAEDMPEFLATYQDNEKTLKLLEAFITIACGYDRLSERRDWFEAAPKWQAAMRHIALAGFAEQKGPRFRWTDKIAPMMRSASLWDEEGRSLEALAEAEQEAEVELAWRTMPDTLREAVLSSKVELFELTKILALSWKDGRWHDFDHGQPVSLSGQMLLARALMERARGTR